MGNEDLQRKVVEQIAIDQNKLYSENILKKSEDLNKAVLDKLSDNNWGVSQGAGFAAEEFHAGSFNLSAAFKDINDYEARIGKDFNKLGQVDVEVVRTGPRNAENALAEYQLKYYKHGDKSGKAISETFRERYEKYKSRSGKNISFVDYLKEKDVVGSKEFNDLLYSGQGLLVPSDQIEDVKEYLTKRMLKYERTDPSHAKSMREAIDRVTTTVSYDGVHSLTLTKSEAEMLVQRVKQGDNPVAALSTVLSHYQSDIFKKALKSGVTAATINMALNMGPAIFQQLEKIFNSEGIDLAELANDSAGAGISSADTLFIQTLSGYFSMNAEFGKFGKSLQTLENKSSVLTVAILAVYDSVKLSIKFANEKISREEYFAGMAKLIVVNGITAAMSFIPAVGFLIGGIVGTIVAEKSERFLIGLAIENGYTYFGLVKQDYTLSEDQLRELGISPLELDSLDIDYIQTDQLGLEQLQLDALNVDYTDIHFLRRGLIGVNKVGYLQEGSADNMGTSQMRKPTIEVVAAKDKKNQILSEKLYGEIAEAIAKNDLGIKSAIWTEENYISQQPKITQNDFFVFVGESKEQAKLKETGNFDYNQAQEAFRKLGMTYAWKGNKALLWIDEKKFADASVEDMVQMFGVAGVDIPEDLKPFILKTDQSLYGKASDFIKGKKNKGASNGELISGEKPKGLKRFTKGIAVVAAGFVTGVGAIPALVAVGAVGAVMDKKKMDEVIDEAYKILITEFVNKDLNHFVEHMDSL